MIKALVAGFGPFPGAARNPSAELARRVARRRTPALADVSIFSEMLPTSYAAVFETLPGLIARHDPDVVLLFGLASRTPYLRVELRAVNRATSFYADATKRKHATRAVIAGAAPELRVLADARKLLSAARGMGVDARLSHDAGRYICNAAFYRTLHGSRDTARPRLVAFVHIPPPRARRRLDRKTGKARPTMDTLVRAGSAILGALTAQARRG